MDVNAVLADEAMGAARVPLLKKPGQFYLGPKITSQSQESLFHPLVAAVRAQLGGLSSPAAVLSVLTTRRNWVLGQQACAEAALTALGLAKDLPSTIAVESPALPELDWPLGTANADRRLSNRNFRLRAGQSELFNGENTSTDKAVAALTDDTVLSAAAQASASAAAMLLQLRCLADVYTRWEVCARLAADLVGAQLASPPLTNAEMLARVLTYARIEGDLSIPPEEDTLEGSDNGADSSHIPLPPGRSRLIPYLRISGYMRCITFLALPQKFSFKNRYGVIVNIDLSNSNTMTGVADAILTLVLGGLDILWDATMQTGAESPYFGGLTAPAGSQYADVTQLQWAALNRQIPTSVAPDTAVGQAKTDYARRLALLSSTPVPLPSPQNPNPSPQADRVTAIGAEHYQGPYSGSGLPFSGAGAEYAYLVLSEGVRYLNRLTYGPERFGAGATPRLPEILVYLLFHMGQEGKAMIASAAGAALNGTSDKAVALTQAMRAAGLMATRDDILNQILNARDTRDGMGNIISTGTQNSVQIATANWDTIPTSLGGVLPGIAPVLGTDAVAQALADYVRYATASEWKSWVKPTSQAQSPQGGKGSSPRGNCIGYAQLYDYLTSQIH